MFFGLTIEKLLLIGVIAAFVVGPERLPRYAEALAGHPTVKLHNYGKTPRPGRKVGHVTAIGDDLDDVVYEARAAAAVLQN